MRGVKRISPRTGQRLERLKPPAGYLVLVQDVEYGGRYRTARYQALDSAQLERGGDFPFETRVARVWQAENAAAIERALHDALAGGGEAGQWFDWQGSLDGWLAPDRPDEAVSLGQLARNDYEAGSQLQGAQITDAPARARPAAAPASPRRRRRPLLAWLLLLVIIAAGVALAIQRDAIRDEIDRWLRDSGWSAHSPTPTPRTTLAKATWTPTTVPPASRSTASPASSPPAARVEIAGEVYYAAMRARARKCPRLSCEVLEVLPPNARIEALRVVTGEPVAGSSLWVEFQLGDERASVHVSTLKRRPDNDAAESLATVSNTPAPTATLSNTPAPTATASNTPRPTATASNTPPPTATLSNTPPPTATASNTPAPVYVVETVGGFNANVRACPETACRIVGSLAEGEEVELVAWVDGDSVNGNARWMQIAFNGETAYVHGGLVKVRD